MVHNRTHPDPSCQFVMEVDALDVGVWAILSQRSAQDQKLYPCAFLSHRLNPAERNYNVSNQELLAVKMALEEWRHWLEGAEQPLLVWTNHKNLEYLHTAKRLNSRQARWALLFTSFNLTVSYRPGSQNVEPDNLSWLFSSSATPSTSETILPTSCLAATVDWGIENLVHEAQYSQPELEGGPANRLFVPNPAPVPGPGMAHSSRLTCHPGSRRTLAFL
jgi:hypothetical protein